MIIPTPAKRVDSLPRNAGFICQLVIHHGTSPRIVPGATTKNTREPNNAHSLCMRSSLVARSGPLQLTRGGPYFSAKSDNAQHPSNTKNTPHHSSSVVLLAALLQAFAPDRHRESGGDHHGDAARPERDGEALDRDLPAHEQAQELHQRDDREDRYGGKREWLVHDRPPFSTELRVNRRRIARVDSPRS